jgi:hypothetical protein
VSDPTRREFVRNSAVTAAGMTVIGAIAAEAASAHDASADDSKAGAEPIVAFVSDPSTGEISVLKGEREVKLRDRKLAREISRVVS